MGDMRKDYVSERFMIVSKKGDKVIDPKKSPFAPGKLKVGPSVFLKVKILLFQLILKILTVTNRSTVNLHMDTITLLLLLQMKKILLLL
jgi:hypothetical protein